MMGSVTFGGQFTVAVIWALSGFAYEAHSKQTEMIKQRAESVETRLDTSTPAGLRTKQPVAVLNSKGCHGGHLLLGESVPWPSPPQTSFYHWLNSD